LFGHSGSHAPQLIHSSVILIAIFFYLIIHNIQTNYTRVLHALIFLTNIIDIPDNLLSK